MFQRQAVSVSAEVTKEGGLLSADAAPQIKVKDSTGVCFLSLCQDARLL